MSNTHTMTSRWYSAFVSYSHEDSEWARWLLKALENYRIPKHLIGTESPSGPVPKRLNRIFLDRKELAAGSSVDAKIREALGQSDTLLVVCSPKAAHSKGVNLEIELFREMRGDAHIFYIIRDGEPFATARGLDPALECFPQALLRQTMETSTIYGVPLAADARPQGDGRKMALLKVVAGILGVNLDTLVRRDLQRRQKRLWGFTALATAGMLLTAGLANHAYIATRQAEQALAIAQHEQDDTESLLQSIIDQLGYTLFERGQVDLLDNLTNRVVEHYEGPNSPNMGPEELAQKLRGINYLLRGKMYQGHSERVRASLRSLYKTSSSLAKKKL